LFERPQLPSLAPPPVRLMLATAMFRPAALALTQSIPHRTWDSVPLPLDPSTLTA
jgi:hypothetical protein